MAQVSDPRYGNWVKDTLFLLYVKEGIVKFIDCQSESFHTQLTATFGNINCACSAQGIIREKKGWAVKHCNGLCRDWLDGILSHHRLRPPVIPQIVPGNVNPKLWPTDYWEVMKTYQPKGCQGHHSASDADIAALLCLMNNCDHFFRFYNYWHHLIDEVMRVRDRLMHSNDFLVDDTTLAVDVQKMLAFLRSLTSLSVAENLSVQAAIDKIEKLHSKTLELSVDRELELTAIRASQVALQAEMRNLEQTMKEVTIDTAAASSGLTTAQDKMDTVETDVLDLRDRVDREVSTLYNRIDTAVSGLSNKVDTGVSGLRNKVETEIQALQLRLQTHVSRIEGLQQEIISQHQSTGNTIYSLTRLQEQFDDMTDELNQVKIQVASLSTMNQPAQLDVEGIQQKLIKMYKARRRHVPLYLLGPERKAPIEDIYVEQRLKIVDSDGRLTPKTATKSDKYIDSLRDVFYADGHKCQYIYISGNAGYGKSVFCSHIVSLWCIAQLEKKTRKLTINEEMMAEFPLLFCVDLRDVTLDESDHSSDEIAQLIKRQLHLSDIGLTDDGLRELLQADGKVFVLMDALDECKFNRILKTGLYNMCTTMVTSRPWKLEVLRSDKEYKIDKELEIVGLKKTSFVELSDKLVTFLNKKWHTNKNSKEFIETMVEEGLEEFLSIPVLHTSILCMWFDEKPFGHSQCSVYSNLIHHQLLTAIHAKDLPAYTESAEAPFPVCQNEECRCQRFSELLWKVSELAFHTLLGSNKGHSLVMDHDQTTCLGLSDEDVNTCMNIGILTQYKLLGNVTDYKQNKSVSFTHKTFQEWFCAVYLSTKLDKAELVKLFSDVICDLNSILELEKVFLFLCGLNADVAAEWTHLIMDKVSLDPRVQDYRRLSSYMCSKGDKLIMRIQDFIVAGLDEAKKNSKSPAPLKLHDVYISTCSLSKTFSSEQILSCDTSGAKSIYMQCQTDIAAWPSSPCMENVVLRDVDLSHCQTFCENFATHKVSVLHLTNVTMTHEQIKCMWLSLGFVENVHMRRINCTAHAGKSRECKIKLDLSKHNEVHVLKYPHLRGVAPKIQITSLPSCFEMDISDLDISECETFIQHLSTTPLSKFHLRNVTMAHHQIECIYRQVCLSDKHIDLEQITCITHLKHRENCVVLFSMACQKDMTTIKVPTLGTYAPTSIIVTWPPFSCLKTIHLSRVDITQCETFSEHFPGAYIEKLHMSDVTMTHDQLEHICKTLVGISDYSIDTIICRTHIYKRKACNLQVDLSNNKLIKSLRLPLCTGAGSEITLIAWPPSSCLEDIDLNIVDITQCDTFVEQFSAANLKSLKLKSVTMTHGQNEHLCKCLASAENVRIEHMDNLICRTHRENRNQCKIQIDLSDRVDTKSINIQYFNSDIQILAWPSSSCLKRVNLNDVDITQCDTFVEQFSAANLKSWKLKSVTMTHGQIEHLCLCLVSIWNSIWNSIWSWEIEHIEGLICRTHEENGHKCKIQIDLSDLVDTKNINTHDFKPDINILAWPSSSCLENVCLNSVDITQCDKFIDNFSAANLKRLKLQCVTMTHSQMEHLCTCLASAENADYWQIGNIFCRTHDQSRHHCKIQIDLSDHVDTKIIRLKDFKTDINLVSWPPSSGLKNVELSSVDITRSDTFIERFSANHLSDLHMNMVTMTHAQLKHINESLSAAVNLRWVVLDDLICRAHESSRTNCKIQIDLAKYQNIKWIIFLKVKGNIDIDIEAWSSSSLVRVVMTGLDISHCETFSDIFSAINLSQLSMKSVTMTHAQIKQLCRSLASIRNINSLYISDLACRTHDTEECTLLRLICPLSGEDSLERIRSQLSNVI